MGWRNPLETSEFEVQAEAYNQLRKVFKNVRGEFHYKTIGNRFQARFDLAILDSSNDLKYVIEVKRANRTRVKKQLDWYTYLTGKPIIPIIGMAQAVEAAERVQAVIGAPCEEHGDIYV